MGRLPFIIYVLLWLRRRAMRWLPFRAARALDAYTTRQHHIALCRLFGRPHVCQCAACRPGTAMGRP